MRRLTLCLLALLLFIPATSSLACSCIGSSVCGHVKVGDAMFVGKVLGVRQTKVRVGVGDFETRQQVFRFAVTETFSGKQRAGEEVEVQTGSGGGDCGYNFVLGERYLVDAYTYNGVLGTGICGQTATEATATATLHELRTMAAHGRLPDLSGAIYAVPGIGGDDLKRADPLTGVPVVLTAALDGAKYRTSTDSDGFYAFATLPPDLYTVDLTLPPDRTTWSAGEGKPLQIQVPQANGTGAACHLSVQALPAGGITGQVVDADGKGMPGFVSAYPEGQRSPLAGWSAAQPTAGDGTFHLHFLAAGGYRVEFMKNGAERGTWYYPEGRQIADARPVQVTGGQTTGSVRLLVK